MSSKLCLNLCSSERIKPNCNLGSSLISTWSCIVKILFSEGLMKFISAFLKHRSDVELRVLRSSFFQFYL